MRGLASGVGVEYPQPEWASRPGSLPVLALWQRKPASENSVAKAGKCIEKVGKNNPNMAMCHGAGAWFFTTPPTGSGQITFLPSSDR